MTTNEYDGFQNERDGQIVSLQQTNCQQISQGIGIDFFNNLKLKDIDPPQQIKTKAYSLEPDIATGWAPKFSLPKPIHLTYPDVFLKSLIDSFLRQRPQKLELCYLGPRYDNTYSAWKYLNIQFPYKHLSERRIVVSDRNFVGNHPQLHTNSLRFNSMFQSGNLDAAFKVDQFQYDCFMRIDANTRGHLQWYYFEVTNLKKNQQYRINICNFQKSKSLYSRGMKPYILSKRANHINKENWKQGGQLIEYTKQKTKLERILKFQEQDQYYQLSFTISTTFQNDALTLAYCPPYTYSNLLVYLQNLFKKHAESDILYEDQIGKTLSGLNMPLITVTNDAQHQLEQTKMLRTVKNKKLIFVMGRIHPGESNGSFMIQGLINWLCSNSPQSKEARERFIFKILPMVNPDGVAIGNYRTGLSGRDLNRQFIRPDKSLFVEVNNIKQLLSKYKKIYHSSFTHFLDFHGHTIKKNVFTYGPEFPITTTKYYECRILPKLISKKTNLFRYFSCKFNVSKSKQSTARAVLIRQFFIPFSYTIQASNGFYVDPQQNNVEFTLQKWMQTGQKIGQALYEYILILKTIQAKREERRKQKQLLNNSRRQRSKKYSSLTKTYQFSIQGTSSKKDIYPDNKQENSISYEVAFNDLINQINQERSKQPICSDDELSQGQSDSEHSRDDIDLHQLKDSIFVAQQKTNKNKKSENHLRVIRIIKRNTLNSEFQVKHQQEKRGFNYMRPRKSAVIRKKFETNAVSTPSPVKTQTNTAAKIININFQLHQVVADKSQSSPLIPQERARKTKTEMRITEMSQTRNHRQDRSDSFRRTFLSFQRDIIRKQSNKKMKRLYTLQKNSFRVEQIVGKRIFTQTSY